MNNNFFEKIYKNEPYKIKQGIVYIDPNFALEITKQLIILQHKYNKMLKNNKEFVIIIVNALSGTLAIAAREQFPKARIICVEYFPFEIKQLSSKMRFEVVDLEMEVENFSINYMNNKLQQKIKKEGISCILGNPPYHNPVEKNDKIWKKFIPKSFDILSKGGIFAFITPNNWTANVDNIYKTYFLNKSPILINLNECAQHFPKIGSPFTYYIIQNIQHEKDHLTKIVSENPITNMVSTTDISLPKTFPNFLPTHVSHTTVSILNKTIFSNHKKYQLYRNCFYHTDTRKKGKIQKVKDDEFNIPVLYSYENTKKPAQYYWAKVLHPLQQDHRLVIWSRPAAFTQMRVTTDATTEGFFHLKEDPTLQIQDQIKRLENTKHNMCLDIYLYIIKVMTPGLNLLTPVMENLPELDSSIRFTNDDIRTIFDFNDIEMMEIKNVTKQYTKSKSKNKN